MKLKLKTDRVGIRWKVTAYLTAFVLVLLVLLWLFQTVFLSSFYRAIKVQDIKSTAEGIAKNLDSDQLQTQLDKLAGPNGVFVRIVGADGQDLYSSPFSNGSILHAMSSAQLQSIYQDLSASGSSVLELYSWENSPKNNSDLIRLYPRGQDAPPPQGEGEGEKSPDPFSHGRTARAPAMETIVYGRLATRDGTPMMILLSTAITPVDATVSTLRVQLVCITVLMLVLSLGLAFLLARRISRPIVQINDSALQLAQGNYQIRFEGGGYREIAQLSDTLNYAAQELGKVEGLRREFIANVSHDLRTPLTMITGYSEVMRDIPGENTPENIQIIIDEAQRLTTLVNDILDLSKLQSGSQALSLRRFSITAAVVEILERYRRLTQRDGYVIDFDFDHSVELDGDENKLTQVIYNLINNAITHTGPDKKVTVCQTVDDSWVTLAVVDSGDGVAPEDLPYIWERYYKVDKTHKRDAIGTGLGLSIVKGIVELHGGRYGVESTPGQGSRFWFSLPLPDKKTP